MQPTNTLSPTHLLDALEARQLFAATLFATGDVPPNGPVLVCAADFDHDGKKDLLWRDYSNGDVYVDLTVSNLTEPPTFRRVMLGNDPDKNWILYGAADFDRSDHPDLIWMNSQTRTTRVWFLNDDLSIKQVGSINLEHPILDGWRIEAIGDFDGDGDYGDIAWRRDTTGSVCIWYDSYMFDRDNGYSNKGFEIFHGPADKNWKIAGTSDFDGDGVPDLLWSNQATGQTAVWKMEHADVTPYARLRPVSCEMTLITPGPDKLWELDGIGDFNGDYQNDLLYRNYDTGEVKALLLNGTTVIGEKEIANVPALTILE